MRILYFNPVGSIGGAEMCLLDLLASTRKARPAWDLLVVLGGEGPLRPAVEALRVRCRVEPIPRSVAKLGDSGGGSGRLLLALTRAAPAAWRYRARLRRLFRVERPDLIQTNGMKAHLLSVLAASPGQPILWHLHDYLSFRPVMARLLRWSARRSKVAVVAVSDSVARDARTVLGPDPIIHAIHNAVDLDTFAPGPGEGPWLDRLASLPVAKTGTVRVGLVATFARWKGHEVFFEAIRRIPRDRSARFYLIGGPIYASSGSQWSYEDLWLAAAHSGVIDRLAVVGPVSEPARAFRSLDIVVHASIRPEPFGRVIVEGMATGRAVIAVQAGGAAELFTPEDSALGCAPNDPEGLARAIDRLILNPDLRRTLGVAARKAAEARFDAAWLLDSWSPIYENLVGQPTSGDARGRSADSEVLNAHGR